MTDTTAAVEAMRSGGAIPSPLWTENQRLQAVNAELRRRVEELEGENAGLLDGHEQLQAALTAAERANAELRAGIATISAHGGNADSSFARARIREALGDSDEAQP